MRRASPEIGKADPGCVWDWGNGEEQVTTQLHAPKNLGGAAPAESDRRRSTRVLLVIPVEVSWTSKDGLHVQEHAETEVVSQHGALLRMGTRLPAATQLDLRRPATGQASKAKVVGVGNPSSDGLARVAVELVMPSDSFWGVSFPHLSPAAAKTKPAAPPQAPTAAGKPAVAATAKTPATPAPAGGNSSRSK